MTKPAAFFLQFIGLILALIGAGLATDGDTVGGGILGVLGLLLILLGGRGIRKRIKADKAN